MLTGIWRNTLCRHRADLDSPVLGHKFGWIKQARSPGFCESSSRVFSLYWSIDIIDAKDFNVSDECYALGYLRILKQFHPHPWSDGVIWEPSCPILLDILQTPSSVEQWRVRTSDAKVLDPLWKQVPEQIWQNFGVLFEKHDLETVPEPWQPRIWFKLPYGNPF